jgi:hypothetical protein
MLTAQVLGVAPDGWLVIATFILAVMTGYMGWQTRRLANETAAALAKAQIETDLAQQQLSIAQRAEKVASQPRLVPAIPSETEPRTRKVRLPSRIVENIPFAPTRSGIVRNVLGQTLIVIAMKNIGSGPAFINEQIPQPSVAGPLIAGGFFCLPAARAIASSEIFDIAVQAPSSPQWTPRFSSNPFQRDITLEVSYSGLSEGLLWKTKIDFEVDGNNELSPLTVNIEEISI